MAKQKAIYAPGELDRVRQHLGAIDPEEAKRMAEKLGGEVGVERAEDPQPVVRRRGQPGRDRGGAAGAGDAARGRGPGRGRGAAGAGGAAGTGDAGRGRGGPGGGAGDTAGAAGRGRPRRRGDPAGTRVDAAAARTGVDDGDESDKELEKILVKASYWDRIRLDRYAAQPEFELKSPGQVLLDFLSPFRPAPDYVNPAFITRRLGEYTRQIEVLVTATRSLFPLRDADLDARLKRASPLAHAILDTLRRWNLEGITRRQTIAQTRPRRTRIAGLASIARDIYKPLYILERLDSELHIRGAYNLLYKILYLNDPLASQKYQDQIAAAMTAYHEIREEIRYLLYPLLMKLVSQDWLSYDLFFTERRDAIRAFLNVTAADQLQPEDLGVETEAGGKADGEKRGGKKARGDGEADGGYEENGEGDGGREENGEGDGDPGDPGDDRDDPDDEMDEETRAAIQAERRAVGRGQATLETLFPQAGWEHLADGPDLYPYFAGVFDLKRGFVNIAPTDPLHQVYILMLILEELFYGLRAAVFSPTRLPSGETERTNEILGEVVGNWHSYLESGFTQEYFPRLADYVRALEGPQSDRHSPYARKLLSDLRWIKRLFFLPYYKLESLAPAPFQKKDITPVYPEIRRLRRALTTVATGIDAARKLDTTLAKPSCAGIENPWEPYVFQIPNPLSRRLDALLSEKNRTNASLIFFTLAVTATLDYLVNSEDSWAYAPGRPDHLFRSVDGQGETPLTGVDTRVDAEGLFREAVGRRG